MKSMYRLVIAALALATFGVGVAATGTEAATKPAAAKKTAATAPAVPAAPTSIGTFSSWTAWTASDSTGLICYISAEPSSSKPDGLNRDKPHFLVVDRKGLGTSNEVQTLIGYPIKKSSAPSAAIDGKTYPMIADGSGAWLAAVKDEDGFVTGLKHGHALLVKGTSQRGTQTTDTYSLAGVTAALDAASKACH